MQTSNSIDGTHVGSLPRPDRMQELLRSNNPIDEFDEIADEAVRRIVRKQADAGLSSINDGEQTRQAFHTFITDRLEGYNGRDPEPPQWADMLDFPEYFEEVFGDATEPKPVATEAIEYGGGDAVRSDIDRLQRGIDEIGISPDEVFYTVPSPGIVATHTRNRHYPDLEAYLFDLGRALSEEYEIVTEAGLTLQIDAPDLLSDGHRYYQDLESDAFRSRVHTHVEALNMALDGIPSDMVRLHACWGNYPGPHHHDVELEAVLPAMYEADVGSLVVEAANPRHGHTYEAFAEHPLPDGWNLVAGVVDVKTNIVEHPRTIADRIARFVDVIGDPDRIRVSPDCGFASVAGFHMVHPDLIWKKFDALVAGARLAEERHSL